jgi:hypothetical protein
MRPPLCAPELPFAVAAVFSGIPVTMSIRLLTEVRLALTTSCTTRFALMPGPALEAM